MYGSKRKEPGSKLVYYPPNYSYTISIYILIKPKCSPSYLSVNLANKLGPTDWMGSESSCAAQQNKWGLPKIDHVNCCMLGWSENDSYIPKTASLKKRKKDDKPWIWG